MKKIICSLEPKCGMDDVHINGLNWSTLRVKVTSWRETRRGQACSLYSHRPASGLSEKTSFSDSGHSRINNALIPPWNPRFFVAVPPRFYLTNKSTFCKPKKSWILLFPVGSIVVSFRLDISQLASTFPIWLRKIKRAFVNSKNFATKILSYLCHSWNFHYLLN